MAEKKNFSCGIIGAGRLGTSLALALNEKNFLSWIIVNSEEKKSELKKILPSEKIFSSLDEISFLPEFIFLTVRDSQIRKIAQVLAEKFSSQLAEKKILHCSGALGLEKLQNCEERGAEIITAHPFQTFPFPSEKFFCGIAWGVEAKNSSEEIFSLIEALGGKGFLLKFDSPEKKNLYHLAAVAASNFLSASIALAKEFADLAEIPIDSFLAPIIRTTVENSLEKISDENFPLSGPIARGDIVTLSRHIEALRLHPELQTAYLHAAQATATIAHRKKILTSEQYEEILRVLSNLRL